MRLFALAAILALLVLYVARRLLSRRSRLPPGPSGLPIIGNLLDMPREYEWLRFGEWSERYGPVIGLTLLGQPLVIVNSLAVAGELLHKRGNIYSDRPPMPMAGQLVGWENAMILLPYGERFREYRKLVQRGLGGPRTVLARTCEVQEAEARRFVKRILRDPSSANLARNITKTTGAIILKVTYGYDTQEDDDSLVDHADRVMQTFTEVTTPGTWLVDVLPFLRHLPEWFPGAGFRRSAKLWRDELHDMVNVPYQFAKRHTEEGKDTASYVSKLIQSSSPDSYDEDLAKWSAVSLYAGGADTTVSSLKTFFLAMTLYQDVQKHAQAELDAVVGADRLPSLQDRPNLPYIDAIVSEVLRWIPIGPLAIPHRASEDDVFDGYTIPKGTIIIPNVWQMLHDPAVYARPDEFDPTRFIVREDKPAEPDPRDACFGFGRRLCPGMHLADQSLFVICATVLAVFDVRKAVDEHGNVVKPKIEYTSGTIWYASWTSVRQASHLTEN